MVKAGYKHKSPLVLDDRRQHRLLACRLPAILHLLIAREREIAAAGEEVWGPSPGNAQLR